jgi:hypothetical protein
VTLATPSGGDFMADSSASLSQYSLALVMVTMVTDKTFTREFSTVSMVTYELQGRMYQTTDEDGLL